MSEPLRAATIAMASTSPAPATAAPAPSGFDFPSVTHEHKYVRHLLENAMHYVAAESQTIDAVSGYIENYGPSQ